MKSTTWCLAVAAVCALFPPPARAVDRSLGFQGALHTSAGLPANGTYAVTFGLYTTQTGGAPVWTSTHPSLVVSAGVFDAVLGPLPDGVLETNPQLWIETKVDTVALPRQLLRAVPYSLVAHSADEAEALRCSGCVTSVELALSSVAAEHLQTAAVTPSAVAPGLYDISVSGTAQSALTAVGFTGSLGGDVTGTQAATTVAGIQGRAVASTAPTNGRVLKWNATNNRWEPSTDSNSGGTVTSVSGGPGLTGTVTTTGSLHLNLSGTGGLSKTLGAGADELGIAPLGIVPAMVAPGTYGISITGAAATADTAGSATSFTGAIGGDVTGTQGATTVARLRGRTVSSTAPTSGQVLKYNSTSSQWEPSTDASGTGTVTSVATGNGLVVGTSQSSFTTSGTVNLRLQSGGGLSTTLGAGNELGIAPLGVTPAMVAPGTYSISVSGSAGSAASAGSFTGSLGGDVTGTQGATSVVKLRGRSLSATAPVDGQVLKYNQATSTWLPAEDEQSSGGVTNVTATAPLVSSGGTTPNLTISTVPINKGGTNNTSLAASQFLWYDGTKVTASGYSNASFLDAGSGTTNYVPKYTSSLAVGNSQIVDNGTSVGVGTSSPSSSAKLDVAGHLQLSGNYNLTTRRGMLAMGTTDGSLATANEVLGAIGFYGYAQSHGQLSYRAGQGFEMVDRSSDAPSLGYTLGSKPYAQLRVGDLIASGDVTAGGVVSAPRFNDSNSSTYYVDPASTSVANRIDVNVIYDRLDTTYVLDLAGISKVNDLRARVFYDLDSTTYKLDPASASRVNDLQVDGRFTYGGVCPAPFTYRTRNHTASSGGVSYTNQICMSAEQVATTFPNAQRTCFAFGGHVCTYSEVYLLAAGSTPSTLGMANGDWLGNRSGDDDVYCINNYTTATNFEGNCDKNNSRPYFCCYSPTSLE